jgi:hypothetical protein
VVDSIIQLAHRRMAIHLAASSTLDPRARLTAFNKHQHSRKLFCFYQIQDE